MLRARDWAAEDAERTAGWLGAMAWPVGAAGEVTDDSGESGCAIDQPRGMPGDPMFLELQSVAYVLVSSTLVVEEPRRGHKDVGVVIYDAQTAITAQDAQAQEKSLCAEKPYGYWYTQDAQGAQGNI